jgi:hypothetical protein
LLQYAVGRVTRQDTGARRTLERILARRFCPPPEAVDRIHKAALPQLETWLDRIIDAPSMQAEFEDH